MQAMAQKLVSGNGVSKDISAAMQWYQRAAQQGSASAQYQLGLLYMDEPQQDKAQALSLFRQAAEQGHVNAQLEAGRLHAEALEKSKDQARKWLVQACERGLQAGCDGLQKISAEKHP